MPIHWRWAKPAIEWERADKLGEKKLRGRLRVPFGFLIGLKELLLFLCALLLCLFLSCHVSILPFHFSWMCGLK
jgi:hypothetical protein